MAGSLFVKGIKYKILIFVFIFYNCSVKRKVRTYKGEDITVVFTNSKKGYLNTKKKDSFPFDYKIESLKTKKGKQYFIYRFSIDAKYKLDFPLSIFSIKNKTGYSLYINNQLIVKE